GRLGTVHDDVVGACALCDVVDRIFVSTQIIGGVGHTRIRVVAVLQDIRPGAGAGRQHVDLQVLSFLHFDGVDRVSAVGFVVAEITLTFDAAAGVQGFGVVIEDARNVCGGGQDDRVRAAIATGDCAGVVFTTAVAVHRIGQAQRRAKLQRGGVAAGARTGDALRFDDVYVQRVGD